ncbi:hypothetical protein [Natronobacterium gregoryi]|uniref:hypothetical protein n=1 Tax=Natronobacterium gregoryi TaxID=44930 RepID=UPI0012DD6ED4|nr:hypothetical protein [Natronobacterium gregoryi]
MIAHRRLRSSQQDWPSHSTSTSTVLAERPTHGESGDERYIEDVTGEAGGE